MSANDEDRCPWCLGSELYRHYHDTEWGVPCTDEQALFELLNLEGAQAGLSWITILNKRDNYRRLFHRFDPHKLVRMRPATLERIASDPGIVRHRGKVEAVVSNARCLLTLHEEGKTLSDLMWTEVNHQPVQNSPRTLQEVPARTAASAALSRTLKRHGFKFVGETICYALMQAAGLVNDHLVSCPQHARVRGLGKRMKQGVAADAGVSTL